MMPDCVDKARNTESMSVLTEMITVYTNQLEEYDRGQFTACASCVGFAGAIIAVIGAIFCSTQATADSLLFCKVVPTLLLLIPGVITLFLYNFAMSCRRVALIRGYLSFLEERLNDAMGQRAMLYSSHLIPKKYSQYPVNKFGPLLLIPVLGVLFVTSLGGAGYFAFQSGKGIDLFNGVCIGFAFICTALTIFFGVTLAGNENVVKEAKESCMQQLFAEKAAVGQTEGKGRLSAMVYTEHAFAEVYSDTTPETVQAIIQTMMSKETT